MAEIYSKVRIYREPKHELYVIENDEGITAVVSDADSSIAKSRMIVWYITGIVLSLVGIGVVILIDILKGK